MEKTTTPAPMTATILRPAIVHKAYRNGDTFAAVRFDGTHAVITRADGKVTRVKRSHFTRPGSPWRATTATAARDLVARLNHPAGAAYRIGK